MGLLNRILGKSDEPPSRPQFAKLLTDALRQAGDQRDIQFDADEFMLTLEDGEGNTAIANLANLHRQYCDAPPDSRDTALKLTVRSLLLGDREPPSEFADARPDILPAVRSRGYYELAQLQAKVQGMDFPLLPSQQIGDHLAAGLVYDLPEAMQGITQDRLDEWGVTFYEAMEAARENLAGLEYQVAAVSDLVYMFATGDSYDASRLLLLDVVRRFGVDGDYIVMVPNRDTLLVTGSNEDGGLAIMAMQAEKALEEHHPLCTIPMRLVGDEWETWMPEHDAPLYQQFKLLAIKSMGSEYGEQKELLDQLHEQTGEGVYVASYSAVEHETDGYQTYCVWSEGVDSLLPKTDLVFFYRGDDGEDSDIPAQVEWDQVQAAFGDLLEPLDMYPPRFRVREFPAVERLRGIVPVRF